MTDDGMQQDRKGTDGHTPWERELLERLAFAALKEQRRARRWGIFFRLVVLAIVITVIYLSVSGSWGKGTFAGRYTAVVQLDGQISA
ncbi:MAG: S49 family peptidase, partial [Pseudomonadota bacterium]|nr:S49 family peptidase [Pseudomonadota bacterium]